MKKIFVEGHRGYCAKYPENTMVSFEAAIDLGVDAFEFDVWLSKDKVPVIMHDGNGRRTCGVDKHVRDMTLEQIKAEMEPAYREKFGEQFVGQGQVPQRGASAQAPPDTPPQYVPASDARAPAVFPKRRPAPWQRTSL